MLETHREKMIEILHEFAQVCLQAAVSSTNVSWKSACDFVAHEIGVGVGINMNN